MSSQAKVISRMRAISDLVELVEVALPEVLHTLLVTVLARNGDAALALLTFVGLFAAFPFLILRWIELGQNHNSDFKDSS